MIKIYIIAVTSLLTSGFVMVLYGFKTINVPLEVLANTDLGSQSSRAMFLLTLGGIFMTSALILWANKKQL